MSVLPLILALAAPALAAPRTFTGEWATTYGDLTMTQSTRAVVGTYIMEGGVCSIEGEAQDGALTFVYKEPGARGDGHFKLAADGESFEGDWRAADAKGYVPWKGRRKDAPAVPPAFEGLW